MKYTAEKLQAVVNQSSCMADVLRLLDLKQAGGNHRHISGLMKKFQISTAHFTGRAWNKNLTIETDERIKPRVEDVKMFQLQYGGTGTSTWRRRLLRMGRQYKCSICDLSLWQQKEITLDIDHIDGNCNNNELTNLRFLCPNCHRQTKTWGRRKC